MIAFVFETINLSGAIASILSFPLIVIPVALFLVVQKARPEMSIQAWQKKVLISLFSLGICAYVVDVADRFGWLEKLQQQLPLTDVTDRTFNRERVLIDGHSYNHCVFLDVTFVVNGGRGEIKNSRIVAPYSIASDNPKINTAVSALNLFGMLKAGFMDRNGVVTPPYGDNKVVPAPDKTSK